MEKVSDYSSPNPRLSHGAPYFSVMMVGLVVLACVDGLRSKPTATAHVASNCEDWDQRAVEGITSLIYDHSASAERKLTEALTQLRRARIYCRAGSVDVAQHDYLSLHQAFPMATGSIKPPPTTVKPDGPITKTSVTK